jgi:hypothetical protein
MIPVLKASLEWAIALVGRQGGEKTTGLNTVAVW